MRSLAGRRAEETALPSWIKPQLTKLVDQPPEGPEWLHELKYDGYRMHARLDRGAVRLLTRTGLDWTHKYPAIAAAIAKLPARQAYLDGELCGIRPDGTHLYPAMPFPSYTRMTDADALAIKAYLFSLPAVRAQNLPSTFGFPYNQRWLMGLWSAFFNENSRFRPVPTQSAEWNRGAYLAEALAHCGECHTPRNLALALDNRNKFAGALTAGWYAFNISSDNGSGIGAWSDDEVRNYLSTGHAAGRGTAAGPIGQAVDQSLEVCFGMVSSVAGSRECDRAPRLELGQRRPALGHYGQGRIRGDERRDLQPEHLASRVHLLCLQRECGWTDAPGAHERKRWNRNDGPGSNAGCGRQRPVRRGGRPGDAVVRLGVAVDGPVARREGRRAEPLRRAGRFL